MRSISFLIALLSIATISPALAQDRKSQVDEIRRQMLALQKKLDALETNRKPDHRVTQIGANRGRFRNNDSVVKIYDLGDLFAVAPAYFAQHDGLFNGESRSVFQSSDGTQTGGLGGGIGGSLGGNAGGGGFFNVRTKSVARRKSREVLKQLNPGAKPETGARVTIDSLVNVITQTISPEIWQQAGGSATIGKLGNALIISADAQSHEQIDQLLNLFRKRWGTLRTISVRAYWLWLDDSQLKSLLVEKPQANARPGEVRAFGLVDEAAFTKTLLAIEKGDDKTRRGYRAAVTCYNGQTVHTLAGGVTQTVSGVTPIIVRDAEGKGEKPKGEIAYKPRLTTLHDGAALQVTPIANVAGKTVVLDLHSRIAEISDQPKAEVAQVRGNRKALSPQELIAAIDRKRVSLQRLSTTLRVPVDRTMLAGGMSFTGNAKGGGGTLYLFVKVSVQELRNDRDEAAAKAKPKGKKQPVPAKRAK